jgi:hypothetical protein
MLPKIEVCENKGYLDGCSGGDEVVEVYRYLWIETQPMGGEMYAKRSI